MAEDLDRLIHQYLEGLLPEEEGRLLNQRIKADPRARRRLAEMAFDTAQFPDVLEAGKAARPEVPPERAARAWLTGPRSSLAAVAVILLAVGIAVVFWPAAPRPAPPTPQPAAASKKGAEPRPAAAKPVKKSPDEGERREGLGREEKRPKSPKSPDRPPKEDTKMARFQGLRGKVKGVVEGKGDGRIALRVLAVDAPEQERASDLVGLRIDVGAGIARNDDLEEAPDPVHLAFLRKAQKGQEIEIDLRYERGGGFVIASLTEEQVEWAGRPGEREEKKLEKKREERGEDRGGEDR